MTSYKYIYRCCINPHIGYSQIKRETLDLDADYRTYCDCSSLISKALTQAGYFKTNPWFWTGNMISYLEKAGFKKYNAGSVVWKDGDILWRKGHTEMVYKGTGTGRGITMGAHSANYSWVNQVSVNRTESTAKNWTYLFRRPGKKYTGDFPTLPKRGYFRNGDKGVNVKRLQKFLNWYGSYDLDIDGEVGPHTTAAVIKFQASEGLQKDGLFGKKSLAAAKEATR